MNELTHLDLFSGIGGFALAAQWSGFRTVGFSEVEPYACRVLAERFPDVPNIGDVRQRANFARFAGRIDVLTGGFPCQPWSVAGKQRGTEDHRHLWPAMCDVIETVRPAWIIGENVPGIISVGLDPVCADLAKLGYAIQPFVVPACAVDARHRRDRVWIVAYANSGVRNRRADISEREAEGGNAVDGVCPALADAKSITKREQADETDALATARRARDEPWSRGESMADTNSERGRVWPTRGEDAEDAWQPSRHKAARLYWLPEPSVGRVANGVPNRAHRLKGLGNSIVPQVAEQFFRLIAQIERGG